MMMKAVKSVIGQCAMYVTSFPPLLTVRPSGQAAGDSSPLPPLRIRLGDDDEWEEMLEEHEEWLDENGHKLVERVVGKGRKNRGQLTFFCKLYGP